MLELVGLGRLDADSLEQKEEDLKNLSEKFKLEADADADAMMLLVNNCCKSFAANCDCCDT